VEFWHVGDDGLSERLAEEVDRAFLRSPDFKPSNGRKPGTLIVHIPTNVDWRRIGNRLQVLYVVEFSSTNGQKLGVHKGSCWENQLAECADRIVKDSKSAARKMRDK